MIKDRISGICPKWFAFIVLLASCHRSAEHAQEDQPESQNEPSTTIMTTPQQRVLSYVQDWHQCWRDCGGSNAMSASMMSSSFIEKIGKWEKSIQDLASRHWSIPNADQSASSFGYPPDHDPQAEKIVKHRMHGDTAVVETELTQQGHPTFYEYRLKLDKGIWRITSMVRFFDDEEKRAFGEADMQSLLEKASFAPELTPPEKGDEPNCEVLFEDGKVVKGTLMQKAEPIHVFSAGKLSLPSGLIIARDFGYSPEDALPLSLKVKPGEYEVEACLLEGRVAAIRLVFASSEHKPLVYRQAMTVDGKSSIIGVDAGNVAICDAQAYMKRTCRGHDRDYESWLAKLKNRVPGAPDVTFLQLDDSDENNAVVSGSGYGDGGYPAYWVFDAKDKLIAFVIDFQIAAEQLYRAVKMPWKPELSGIVHDEPGLVVEIDRGHGVVLRGSDVSEARWLDAAGGVVALSHQFASSYSSDERTYSVDFSKLDQGAVTLEVQIYTGFRNNR